MPKEFVVEHKEWISCVVVNENNTEVVSAGGGGRIILWHFDKGTVKGEFYNPYDSNCYSLALGYQGAVLFAGYGNGELIAYDFLNKRIL